MRKKLGDYLHEMSVCFLGEKKKKKCFKMLSAEIFQDAKG